MFNPDIVIGFRVLEFITSGLCLYATYLLVHGDGRGSWWGMAGQMTGLYCIMWGGYWGWLPLDFAMGVIYGKACWERLKTKRESKVWRKKI